MVYNLIIACQLLNIPLELYNDSIENSVRAEPLPRNLQFGLGIEKICQVVNLPKIKSSERLDNSKPKGISSFVFITSKKIEENVEPKLKNNINQSISTIAFGSRIDLPVSIPIQKNTSRSISPSNSLSNIEQKNSYKTISIENDDKITTVIITIPKITI